MAKTERKKCFKVNTISMKHICWSRTMDIWKILVLRLILNPFYWGLDFSISEKLMLKSRSDFPLQCIQGEFSNEYIIRYGIGVYWHYPGGKGGGWGAEIRLPHYVDSGRTFWRYVLSKIRWTLNVIH